jgi:hypothetical protein
MCIARLSVFVDILFISGAPEAFVEIFFKGKIIACMSIQISSGNALNFNRSRVK